MNHYGPTETTVGALTFAVSPESRPETANVPLGRPLPNLRVYVLDASMAPTPTGVPGEVYIGGAGVTRGYLGQPELTAARFVPDPWRSIPGARLYRTGDRARYLPDGALLFLGRIDLQVKVRGYRVELGEIEAALVARPAVAEAVVLAPEESPGVRRLVAYVVPKGQPAPDAADLGAALRRAAPRVHGAVCLRRARRAAAHRQRQELDRRALAAVQPRAKRADDDAPRSPVEEVLVSIWADVFGRERVGIHERFADLGGHSLLATIQIVARARDAFQTELLLRAIFERRPPSLCSPRRSTGRSARPRAQRAASRARPARPRYRALLRPGAAVVPAPTRSRERRLQRTLGAAPGRIARRGCARTGARRGRAPP